MDTKELEFIRRLFKTYKIEAREHLFSMRNELIKFENCTNESLKAEIVEIIYRDAHSLKGASRAVNLKLIESVCQVLESIFSRLKKNELHLDKPSFDLIHYVINRLEQIVDTSELDNDGNPIYADDNNKLNMLLDYIVRSKKEHIQEFVNNLIKESKKEQSEEFENIEGNKKEITIKPAIKDNVNTGTKETKTESETIRISTEKLDKLFYQAEELINAKYSYLNVVESLKDIVSEKSTIDKKFKDIKNDIKSLSKYFKGDDAGANGRNKDLVNKVLNNIEQILLKEHGKNEIISSLHKSSMTEGRVLSNMVDNLMHQARDILLVPFKILTNVLPLVIRDLSISLGKSVNFTVKGEEIEIDRRILEVIKDPFIHLIRNSLDHGIENPETRKQAGKSESGNIVINIKQIGGNKVEILITDDGKGLNYEDILDSAIRKGIIKEEQKGLLNEKEIIKLVFVSDVSTSKVITDISGRGLGLAIVKEKIEQLDGYIELENGQECGTVIKITLPLSLTTFRGVLISLEDKQFLIPTLNIERIKRIKIDEIKNVENKETISLNDEVIPVINLKEILSLKSKTILKSSGENIIAVIIEHSGKKIAVTVDDIIIEQEVLVKNLGKQILKVKNIQGAAVLGSGKVVPILDVKDLILFTESEYFGSIKSEQPDHLREKTSYIMVADDSITSRMLIKDILESEGFRVKTAVDGLEALTALKTEKFDLIVSDIEMPRMNGFELTERIKGDKNLSELPVILITALASKEDRERGIDAGANAYIVKSSFDQSNLIDIINRLI